MAQKTKGYQCIVKGCKHKVSFKKAGKLAWTEIREHIEKKHPCAAINPATY